MIKKIQVQSPGASKFFDEFEDALAYIKENFDEKTRFTVGPIYFKETQDEPYDKIRPSLNT